MKPDKAIEILELNTQEAGKKMPLDVLEALELSIESLKLYLHNRCIGSHVDPFSLPGEY